MNDTVLNDRRLARWTAPAPDAAATVYCFPHAGGGAASIRPLAVDAPATLDVVGVRLAGREKRFAEEPLTDLADVAADAAAAIDADPLRDARPVVLLGHCFGAVLAYQVARALVAERETAVLGVVLLAQAEPEEANRVPPTTLPDAEFVAQMAGLGGIPPEVLENPEIVELVLPAMRADVSALGSFETPDPGGLPVPIVVIHGTADALSPPGTEDGWLRLGRGGWATRLPAGHFLLSEQPSAVLREVQRLVEPGRAR